MAHMNIVFNSGAKVRTFSETAKEIGGKWKGESGKRKEERGKR